MDSRSPDFSGFEEDFSKDYASILGEDYPEASEEVDCNLAKPLVNELDVTVSYHISQGEGGGGMRNCISSQD